MPLINKSSQSEVLDNFTPYDHQKMQEAEFSEVFDASLGYVIDEELSISTSLNREGWSQRKAIIDKMVESGELDNVDQYRPRSGFKAIDYNKVAGDLKRDDIKTDDQLTTERNALLKSRRDYSQEVISRGSGTAQFLGAMNGYMLDPVNILTVGIATPAVTAKAISIIGRAALTARNAAVIGGATEIGIQAFVYQHKQEIDSPYSAGDALANVAMAATGAGVIGGVTGGLSGWLRKVRETADELPETPELKTAKESLQRQEDTLKGSEKIIFNEDSIKKVSEKNPYLYEVDPHILVKTEHGKDISSYKGDSSKPIVAVQDEGGLKILDGHHRAEIAKRDGVKIKAVFIPAEAYKAMKAKGIHQGEMFKEFNALKPAGDRMKAVDAVDIKQVSTDIHAQQVKNDIEYLKEMDNRAKQYAPPSKDKSIYEPPPAQQVKPKAPVSTASQREHDILKAQGLDEVYNEDMAKFNRLDNKVMDVDGEAVDAAALVKSYDEEIQGLDDVLRCIYG